MNNLEDLSKYSLIKIGSLGKVLIPCSVNKLIQYYGKGPVIGRGSNVLMKPTTKQIICTKKLTGIKLITANTVKVQCGTMNYSLLLFLIKHSLGDIEYLASIPGTLGGAIFMNAGRGEKHNLFIGQRVKEVEIFDGEKIKILSKDECDFKYRKSIFHYHPNWIIISATLELDHQKPVYTLQKIKERIKYAQTVQDLTAPSLGTIFSKGYEHRIDFNGIRYGDIKLSSKTPNWMLNLGNGTYENCINLINEIQIKHHVQPELEIQLL